MKYVRIYADAEGESHFEDVELDLTNTGGATNLSEVFAATGVVFRRTSGDYNLDWHPAPRKQFIVNLVGEVEIEVSDGEVRRLGQGEVFLAEDVTGKGHLSRSVGGAERLSLFIHAG